MTHRIGTKGQVVIPKEIRDEIGLDTGDDVDFSVHDDEVIMRRATPHSDLCGRYRGTDLTGALVRERADERAREDAR